MNLELQIIWIDAATLEQHRFTHCLYFKQPDHQVDKHEIERSVFKVVPGCKWVSAFEKRGRWTFTFTQLYRGQQVMSTGLVIPRKKENGNEQ